MMSALKANYLKIVLVIIALAIIGLSTINQYGVAWDEEIEVQIVQNNLAYVLEGRQMGPDVRYHGFIFNFVAEALFQARKMLGNQLPATIASDTSPAPTDFTPAQLYTRLKLKHILTFLLSLVAYLSVAGIVGILAGWKFTWLSPIILALFPSFWGHSFFNPKDIPFATLFTLATFAGAYLVDLYSTTELDNPEKYDRQLSRYSILYGILVGLVTGIRIGGFFLLFFIFFTHLIVIFPRHKLKSWQAFYSLRPYYGLMILYWALTTLVVYPASWFNSLTPIGWFFQAITAMSKYKLWDNHVVFEGKSILGSALPWYYLPKTLHLTIPFVWQILFALGLYLAITKYHQFTTLQKSSLILVLLQITVIPLMAIVRNSTMYDGMRHFMFVLPGISVIATSAIIWSMEKLKQKSTKIFALTILIVLCSPIVIDMIQLHPYQYVYYNRISGGLAKANNNYETDYWGLSIREAMEWINNNVKPNSKIVVTGPLFASEIFAEPELNLKIIHLDNFEEGVEANPDYYLGLHRGGYPEVFAECAVVHQVKRQGVPLTTIKKCSVS